jgi:hypothetical protein
LDTFVLLLEGTASELITLPLFKECDRGLGSRLVVLLTFSLVLVSRELSGIEFLMAKG